MEFSSISNKFLLHSFCFQCNFYFSYDFFAVQKEAKRETRVFSCQQTKHEIINPMDKVDKSANFSNYFTVVKKDELVIGLKETNVKNPIENKGIFLIN